MVCLVRPGCPEECNLINISPYEDFYPNMVGNGLICPLFESRRCPYAPLSEQGPSIDLYLLLKEEREKIRRESSIKN